MPSPYLTTKEAAEFLRYSVSGFRKAVERYRIPHICRGHQKLFTKADLIRVWTGDRPRRPAQVGPKPKIEVA